MIVLFCFLFLGLLTIGNKEDFEALRRKSARSWSLDASGLVVQGILVPAVQVTLIYSVLSFLIADLRGALNISFLISFLLNFILIDYIYYWNHRLLHHKKLWPIHQVHHTADHMEVFITSRNTLWSPVFILYMWLNGLFVYLLKDAEGYVLGAALTASLDLWRHSRFHPKPGSSFHRLFCLVFISPLEHAWHHSQSEPGCNYGANFALWDRIHGTYRCGHSQPLRLGIPVSLSFFNQLLNPYSKVTTGK